MIPKTLRILLLLKHLKYKLDHLDKYNVEKFIDNRRSLELIFVKIYFD